MKGAPSVCCSALWLPSEHLPLSWITQFQFLVSGHYDTNWPAGDGTQFSVWVLLFGNQIKNQYISFKKWPWFGTFRRPRNFHHLGGLSEKPLKPLPWAQRLSRNSTDANRKLFTSVNFQHIEICCWSNWGFLNENLDILEFYGFSIFLALWGSGSVKDETIFFGSDGRFQGAQQAETMFCHFISGTVYVYISVCVAGFGCLVV